MNKAIFALLLGTVLFGAVAPANAFGCGWGCGLFGRRARSYAVANCSPRYGETCASGSCSASTCGNGACQTSACDEETCAVRQAPTCAGGTCAVRQAPTTRRETTCSNGVCQVVQVPDAEPGDEQLSPEEQFVVIANRWRALQGRAPLELDDSLKEPCEWNSIQCARIGRAAHFGRNTRWEIATPGATPNGAIEVFRAWRNRSQHWAILTNPSYRKISVGKYLTKSGGYWTAQLW